MNNFREYFKDFTGASYFGCALDVFVELYHSFDSEESKYRHKFRCVTSKANTLKMTYQYIYQGVVRFVVVCWVHATPFSRWLPCKQEHRVNIGRMEEWW